MLAVLVSSCGRATDCSVRPWFQVRTPNKDENLFDCEASVDTVEFFFIAVLSHSGDGSPMVRSMQNRFIIRTV